MPELAPARPAAHCEPRVEIVYDTDPLCAWSWAFEPAWRRLRYEFGRRLLVRVRMGGLIPDWSRFSDPLYAVARPAQMGPVWTEIQATTGMPLTAALWVDDPPSSSYPACLAFAAARLQGPWAADAYLRQLREAVMLHGRNIARHDVLLDVAAETSALLPPDLPLDVPRFWRDFHGAEAKDGLRADLRESRYEEIERFPTVTLAAPGGPPVRCVGRRPYAALRQALEHVAPQLKPLRAVSLPDYVRYWGRLTLCELAEALEIAPAEAEAAVEDARARGDLDGDEILRATLPLSAREK